MSHIDHHARARRAWLHLVATARQNGRISYGDLTAKLGLHHRTAAWFLGVYSTALPDAPAAASSGSRCQSKNRASRRGICCIVTRRDGLSPCAYQGLRVQVAEASALLNRQHKEGRRMRPSTLWPRRTTLASLWVGAPRKRWVSRARIGLHQTEQTTPPNCDFWQAVRLRKAVSTMINHRIGLVVMPTRGACRADQPHAPSTAG